VFTGMTLLWRNFRGTAGTSGGRATPTPKRRAAGPEGAGQ
jgi:hypothetical protein